MHDAPVIDASAGGGNGRGNGYAYGNDNGSRNGNALTPLASLQLGDSLTLCDGLNAEELLNKIL